MAASPLEMKITMPPETVKLLLLIGRFPGEIPKAIKRGVDRGLQIVAGRIQQRRLSGKGPYPVSDHRLGERTGQLRRSVRAEPATVQGGTVTASIGTPVVYGAVHEFGATIVPRSAPYLVFEINGKKIRTRKAVIPARAPFSTEILLPESAQVVTQEISSAVDEAATSLFQT